MTEAPRASSFPADQPWATSVEGSVTIGAIPRSAAPSAYRKRRVWIARKTASSSDEGLVVGAWWQGPAPSSTALPASTLYEIVEIPVVVWGRYGTPERFLARAVGGYARKDAAGSVVEVESREAAAGRAAVPEGSRTTDHGALGGLADDDHTIYQKTAEGDSPDGYARLNSVSRTTKGVDTTDDLIVDLATKGLVLKSPNAHYWRETISDAGVTTWTDLGTTKP
jgi:hypothetical protein